MPTMVRMPTLFFDSKWEEQSKGMYGKRVEWEEKERERVLVGGCQFFSRFALDFIDLNKITKKKNKRNKNNKKINEKILTTIIKGSKDRLDLMIESLKLAQKYPQLRDFFEIGPTGWFLFSVSIMWKY